MDFVGVEPLDGHELDRMITALLNVTGAAFQVIQAVDDQPNADGVEVIGKAAERLRRTLVLLVEHYGDDDLATVTQVLAETTLLIAAELDLDVGLFQA
jgi:hypothetical protein